MSRPLQRILLALTALASSAGAAELSGTIHSATGKLPVDVKMRAESFDQSPAIAGTVENGRYRIDLPEGRTYVLRAMAPGWEAAPKHIPGPVTGAARDILLYPARVPEPQLAEELIRLGKADQAIRQQIPQGKDPDFWKRMESEDKLREQRLAQIIADKGWPLVSQVGHEAAKSAWLIAQHGASDFLERCLPLMQAAADRHELPLSSLALSIDRVLMHKGKEQRYGSQFGMKDGHTVPYPIEDMAHLDERRASMGLEPYEQYHKRFD